MRPHDAVERPDPEAVLGGLKGFQRDTVEYAFERLYRASDSTRRFLVADEVGLGKTLVARGVIAKAIDHLWEGPHKVDAIDIVYICSNAQIARQNIRRLQIGSREFVRADRLTLLPQVIQDLRARRVNYLALTPGTSLNLGSSLGFETSGSSSITCSSASGQISGQGPRTCSRATSWIGASGARS